MDPSEITTQPATVRNARRGDADVCAQLLRKAGGALLRWGFADPSDDRLDALLATTWPEDAHVLSWEWGTVVELDGEVVGLLMAYTQRQYLHAQGGSGLVFERACDTAWLRAMVDRAAHDAPSPPRDTLYIGALAVVEHARRRGLGNLLLQHAAAEAVRRGCIAISLDVLDDNEGAKALYADFGFQHARSWHPADHLTLQRLVAPLG